MLHFTVYRVPYSTHTPLNTVHSNRDIYLKQLPQ